MRHNAPALRRYLVRTAAGFVFQKRIPRDLNPESTLSPLRVTLGAVPLRIARQRTNRLAGAAEQVFAVLRMNAMQDGTDGAWLGMSKAQYGGLLALLRGMDQAAANAVPDPHVARAMVEAGIDGLVGLAVDAAQDGPLSRLAPQLERHFLDVIQDEAVGRRYLNLPSVPADQSLLAEIRQTGAAVTTLLASHAELQEQLKGSAHIAPKAPLFSEAAAAYIKEIEDANGPRDGEIGYLRHRTAIFLKMFEDKRVTAYTRADLQHFVNEICYLPPNISKKDKEYRVEKVLEYIEQGKAGGVPLLARSTLVNNYLGKVKTILKAGCESVGVNFPLATVNIRLPKGVKPPVQKLLPDDDMLNAVFREAVASGNLATVLLPLLGYVTGRRLAVLVFLRREDIFRYNGAWVVTPRPVVFEEGQWTVVPYKTEESLTFFVLHDLFTRIGLLDYIEAQPDGFIFADLHENIVDPADTAQKRMGRLFRSAGVNPAIFKVFHGLRHAKINHDRELKIDPRTSRLQVGHELGDVHEGYGGSQMRPSELREVAHAELPVGIDWSVFEGLNFQKLAQSPTKRGRPAKRA